MNLHKNASVGTDVLIRSGSGKTKREFKSEGFKRQANLAPGGHVKFLLRGRNAYKYAPPSSALSASSPFLFNKPFVESALENELSKYS
jgi:hypothetical protein